MGNRIKVAMVCHFSNPRVREHLPLNNQKLYNFVRSLMRLPRKSNGYGDVASWDTNIIDNLSKRDDVELYVLSAHSGLKKNVSFNMDGVHYYFMDCTTSTAMKHLISSPKVWHALNPLRPKVRKIIHKIQPDIIALIGAENAYYSGTIVGIKDFPVICKCQTIYNNPKRRMIAGGFDEKNAYVEQLIFKDLKYVSFGTKMECRMFREYNKQAYNFKWNFATTYFDTVPVENKEFDFVNFAASMSQSKGYPDAIKALAKVKVLFPNIKLNLVGSSIQKEEWMALVREFDLEDNVVFTPFFEKQEDLFQHIQKSQFALLPYKLDYISSTTYQAMHYGLPVVCYRTEGTPTLNQDEERVLIAEHGDIEDLASKMLDLLQHPEKAELLRTRAKAYEESRNDGKKLAQQMVNNFRAIINNFKSGEAIPPELLVDESGI